MTGQQDVLVGEIGGIPFFMNREQYKLWKHTNLIIDAIDGGGGMFSLDNGTGKRFLTRSEMCQVPERSLSFERHLIIHTSCLLSLSVLPIS